jgi:hypothetical protein
MRDRTEYLRKEEEDKIIQIAKSKHDPRNSRSRSRHSLKMVDQDASNSKLISSTDSPTQRSIANRSSLTTSRLEEFEMRLKKYD